MNNLLEFLNTRSLGLAVDESTPTIVLFGGYYLILSVLILLNVINISIYLLSIYIASNEKLLSKIPAKYGYIHKLIKFYINIRIGYIIIETIFLICLISIMIFISYGLVSYYISIK